jgi:hypothetical protein
MKRKTILWALLAVVVVANIVGFLVWNKPHDTVDNKEGIKITAEALTKAFEANEQSANGTYINKVMEVSGVVSEVSKNQDGRTVILLQSEDPLSGVQCTMKDDKLSFNNGQQASIKGFCNGYTSVVLLTDCVQTK